MGKSPRRFAMTTVLFIHSAGLQGPEEGSSGLLESLRAALPSDYKLIAPTMPNPVNPEAEPWIAACQSEITGIEEDTVLVGHSLGGSTILQTLARFGIPVNLLGVIIIAAPFWGAPDWEFDTYKLPEDASEKLLTLPRLIVMQGDADEVVAADHPDRYRAILPNAEIRRLPGVDHGAMLAGPALAEAIESVAS
jgi:uncharacterized protein